MPHLHPSNDPMGQAIADYWTSKIKRSIEVLSNKFGKDTIETPHLFRAYNQMPIQEQQALMKAEGRILDVGAGAGCHSLALMKMRDKGRSKIGPITAIDQSELSVKVMLERGVENAICADIFDENFTGEYDTILLMMNGLGIAGTLENLTPLLQRLANLLSENGQILADSTDISYFYGNKLPKNSKEYYGECKFSMTYRNNEGKIIKSNSFPWIYPGLDVIEKACSSCGLMCQKIADGKSNNFTVRITKQ